MKIALIPDPNPWEDADAHARLRLPSALLLSLILIACAVYLTVPAPSTAYTVVMLAVCIGTQLLFVHAKGAAVGVGLLSAIVFVCGSLFGGMAGGTFALCLLTTLAFGAFVITTTPTRLLVLVPAVAYFVAWPLCGSALTAALALLALPAAGLLAYCTMKNTGRVGTVCATSFMLGLCAVLVFAVAWYRHHGSISFDALMDSLMQVREELITLMQGDDYTALLRDMLKERGLSEHIDAAALIRVSVELIFNLLPALVVLSCNLFAFAAQTLCNRAYVGSGMPSLVTRTSQLFIMSIPSGIIFIVCGAVSLFTMGATQATAVMLNVALILLPPMCIVGFFKTVADLHNHASPFTVLLIVAGIICAPGALVLCLAFSGALTTVIRPLITRMLLQQQKNDRNDP